MASSTSRSSGPATESWYADRADPAVFAGIGVAQRGGQSGADRGPAAARPESTSPRRPRSTGARGGRAGQAARYRLLRPARLRRAAASGSSATSSIGRSLGCRPPPPSSVTARWISMCTGLSATSRSTAALSAPSGDAGAVSRPRGRRCASPRGKAAYRAATWAIATSITSPPPRRSDSPIARAASSPLSGSAIASPRNTGPSTDQAARDRGVVTEGRPVRLVAIAPDAQPDSARRPGTSVGVESTASQRRGPRAFDDDVGDTEQPAQRIPSLSKSTA